MPLPVPVLPADVDPARLPSQAWRPLGERRTLIRGTGPLVDTVHGEVASACGLFGGEVIRGSSAGERCDLVPGIVA